MHDASLVSYAHLPEDQRQEAMCLISLRKKESCFATLERNTMPQVWQLNWQLRPLKSPAPSRASSRRQQPLIPSRLALRCTT